MDERPPRAAMPPLLLIAAIQGGSLYILHWRVEHGAWPATDPRWIVPLYAITILVPLTLQNLVEELRQVRAWLVVGSIALFTAVLGAYCGWSIGPLQQGSWPEFPVLAVFYATLFAIWFIALPFIQTWLRFRRRVFPYRDLFEFSWRNMLVLFEAAVFTGIFWGLLGLWAALFKIVDIYFFAELFSQQVFIYPVTTIAFGYATYLVQSRASIVVTLRGHLLGVLSWLFPLVAMIAALFLLVLPFTGLAPLWQTKHASALMLCLQALFIFFINAAYQDGENEPTYPGWLKGFLRAMVFGMPVYAALCGYAVGLRVDQHGWTVDRVWAALTTFLAALYGLGYAAVALRGSPWMGRLARINVSMAWVTAGLLVFALTPPLDPKRLSANSQIARLSAGKVTSASFDYDYLRFELGRYGWAALTKLAESPKPDAARLASLALAKTSRWGQSSLPLESAEDLGKRIKMYPAGTVLDPPFLDYLTQSVQRRASEHPNCLTHAGRPCLMLALDLDGDGQPEIISLDWPRIVYGKRGGQWSRVGRLTDDDRIREEEMENLLRRSRFRTKPHAWQDVAMGDHLFMIKTEF